MVRHARMYTLGLRKRGVSPPSASGGVCGYFNPAGGTLHGSCHRYGTDGRSVRGEFAHGRATADTYPANTHRHVPLASGGFLYPGGAGKNPGTLFGEAEALPIRTE